jgi:GT2 family glycosyltransferase
MADPPAAGHAGAEPRTTVVVVTWNGAHLLPACLDALAAQTVCAHVLVVDNASTDGTDRLLADAYPWAEVLPLGRNTGFSGGAAAGLSAVRTAFLALLNNDAVPAPDWLAALEAALDAHPGAAAVTSRLMLPDGRVNNTGVLLTRWGNGVDRGYGDDPAQWAVADEVTAVSGGAVLLRTEAVRAVGGFPEDFFLYYEDVDLSARLRAAGWSLRYAPDAIAVHEHAASSDRRSESFAYYNLRNHQLFVLRAMPPVTVVAAVVRFVGVTLVDLLRPAAAPSPLHDRRVRLRVARDVLRGAPAAIRHRRAARSVRSVRSVRSAR